METHEEILTRVKVALPNAKVEAAGESLLVPPDQLLDLVRFLMRPDPFGIDYVSNLTAVDFPGEGYVDVVYHLYSMAGKKGPIVVRTRPPREVEACRVPSVTPLLRGAEYQEREVYDLFGVAFEGHPDLRRILMWEGFRHHPLRKDYVCEDEEDLSEFSESEEELTDDVVL